MSRKETHLSVVTSRNVLREIGSALCPLSHLLHNPVERRKYISRIKQVLLAQRCMNWCLEEPLELWISKVRTQIRGKVSNLPQAHPFVLLLEHRAFPEQTTTLQRASLFTNFNRHLMASCICIQIYLILVLHSYPAILKTYSWFPAQVFLLTLHREPYVMLEINPRLATCKANKYIYPQCYLSTPT